MDTIDIIDLDTVTGGQGQGIVSVCTNLPDAPSKLKGTDEDKMNGRALGIAFDCWTDPQTPASERMLPFKKIQSLSENRF